MSALHSHTYKETAKLGEGIYLTSDVARILNLPYHKVYQCMRGFWQGYAFGKEGNRAVNFYSLIEFFIFYQCRQNGMSAQQFKKLHTRLSQTLKTRYPFAHHKISTDYKQFWAEVDGNLVKADGKQQFDFLPLMANFLHNLSYGKNSMATQFFPLGKKAKVVVDPLHQFGQPVVSGTNIKTKSLYNLHLGGESLKTIGLLYNISEEKVRDAIKFHSIAA